ncbi:MAG: FtsW/RodA/SpoVE family cell cycle protein [Sedimentisphaerales bacterium]|nr:FtsW/RodA/SpoVE family cell cycle protein [Sedimentisphaerales bacterium]
MKIKMTGKTIANIIACLVVTLMALGVVFVFSASARIDAEYDLSKFYSYPEFRQIVFFMVSMIILFAFSRLDYRKLGFCFTGVKGWIFNISVLLVVTSIILLVLVLFLGAEVNYARRWFRIPAGPVTINFQPSELAKWSLVLFICAVSVVLDKKIKNFRIFVLLSLLIGLVVGLIVIEDFGTAVFVAFISLVILFAAGAKWWHFLTPLPVLAAVFAFAIFSSPERIERVKAFILPDDSIAQTSGYQIRQSLIAISTGRIFGKGLGRGISKYGHLPEDTTDFIFAIIAEEFGFLGVCFVILLFLLLLFFGIIIICRCNDDFGRLLAFGIVLAIVLQAVINLGVVTRLLPTKGIALPFISAGGTHLFLSAMAAGILMSIAKRSNAG